MSDRFFEALEAHRAARQQAIEAAEAERGPLTPIARRLVARRAKVDPKYESLSFVCPMCLEKKWYWADKDQPEMCKACRKWC